MEVLRIYSNDTTVQEQFQSMLQMTSTNKTQNTFPKHFLPSFAFLRSRSAPLIPLLTFATWISATVSISTTFFRPTSKVSYNSSHSSLLFTLTFFSGREDGPATWTSSIQLSSESEIEIVVDARRRFSLLVAPSRPLGFAWDSSLISNLRNGHARFFSRHTRHCWRYFPC